MATLDLFEKIIKLTPASTDQEHYRILIYNNPKIPSRMKAGLKDGEDPLPELVRTARALEKAGADFLIMPCHTAHIWLERIQSQIGIPIISLIETTVSYIQQHHLPLSKSILLLSSKATIMNKLYQQAFQKHAMKIHIPTPEEQVLIDQIIQQVKASNLNSSHLSSLNEMLDGYYQRGLTALLGCCTEIPLLFPLLHPDMEKLDPTQILAIRAINYAKQTDGGELL